MIISALRTSEKLAKAMESRALGLQGTKRPCLRDIHFRPADYVYTALLVALFSVLLTLRFQLALEPIRYTFSENVPPCLVSG